MVVLGFLSGVASFIVPTEALGKELLTFDVLRFYYAHFIILTVPFLMLSTKWHRLKFKNIFMTPFIFYAILFLILFNEIILLATGFVEGSLDSLFDPNVRNSSFLFGPTEEFEHVQWIFTMLSPRFFRTIPIGANAGAVRYWPVIWLVVPAFIYLSFSGLLIYFVFNIKERRFKR